jgi:hypothetical protein
MIYFHAPGPIELADERRIRSEHTSEARRAFILQPPHFSRLESEFSQISTGQRSTHEFSGKFRETQFLSRLLFVREGLNPNMVLFAAIGLRYHDAEPPTGGRLIANEGLLAYLKL